MSYLDKQIFSIYKCECLINKKVYIGFTKNINRRIIEHKYHYKTKVSDGYDAPFYRAIRKYGWGNFKFTIIYQSYDGEHTLNVMEKYFIKEYNSYVEHPNSNGYNSTIGGDGNTMMTTATKLLLSKSISGSNHYTKKMSPEELNNHMLLRSGVNHPTKIMSDEKYEQYINKQSNDRKGKNHYSAKMDHTQYQNHLKVLSEKRKQLNIKSWNNNRVTQDQKILVWKNADVFYKLFLVGHNTKDKLGKITGIHRNKLAQLVKKFVDGWIPTEDETWIAAFLPVANK